MKLNVDHNLAKQRIAALITEGNSLLEKVTSEYIELRRVKEFSQDKHIPLWTKEYSHWLRDCMNVLGEIFPTQKEVIKLKNVPVSPVMQHGTNMRWGSLTNTIKAKLSALDEISEDVESYLDGTAKVYGHSTATLDGQLNVRRNQVKLLAIALFILGIAIALITNIASSSLPKEFEPYLWLSWPFLIILTVIAAVLLYKQQE